MRFPRQRFWVLISWLTIAPLMCSAESLDWPRSHLPDGDSSKPSEIAAEESFPQQVARILSGRTEVVISPNGQLLAGVRSDGKIAIWDLQRREVVRLLAGHEQPILALAISPDNRILISAGHDLSIRFWDLQVGRLTHQFAGHSSWIQALAVSSDGQLLASGSGDHSIRIWSLRTVSSALDRIPKPLPEEVETPEAPRADKPPRRNPRDPRHRWLAKQKSEEALDASPTTNDSEKPPKSGSTVNTAPAPSGVEDKVPKFSSTTLLGHTDSIYALAFSPDGQFLVSSSWDNIKIWDLATREEVRTLTGQSQGINAIAISEDGRTLVSGSSDRTIHVWDFPSGELRFSLKGHTAGVSSLAIVPGSSTLVSGSWDNTIRLWDLETGQPMRTLSRQPSIIESLSISPDGTTFVSGGWGNVIKLWRLPSGTEVRTLSPLNDQPANLY